MLIGYKGDVLEVCVVLEEGWSHVIRHTSHVTRHTSHVTRHTSHVTHHTPHATRHTSHVTRHTPHLDSSIEPISKDEKVCHSEEIPIQKVKPAREVKTDNRARALTNGRQNQKLLHNA